MQTVKPQRAAFLLNLSVSSHRLSNPNYQDQTTTTTTALHSQTPHPPQTGALYQPHQHGSMEDLEEQVSGLNTSGANSTIHEYVNMLSVNDETDSKDYDAIFRMVPPTKRQQKAQNKRSSLEIKLSSQENLYNLGVNSGYATTRGGGKAEAYSTLKDLKNLIKQPSHKKRESDLGVIKEKGKDITRTSPPLKSKMGYSKSCSKQSISKITASFQNPNFNQKGYGSSGFGLSSSKSRRIPTEGNSKEIKQHFHHSSRLSTMPNDERHTFTEVMSPKTIAKQYINLGSPSGEHKNKNLIMSPGSVGSHKRGDSSQSPGRSLQISLKTLNTGVSISRAVHAIATSRIDITRDKKAAQQYCAQKSETARKSEDQRSKENKPLKAVKIDIVEVNLAPKSSRKRNYNKAEECLEKIDENFDKLRKLINDKKSDISQNEILLKALENLNTYITGTQTLIQTSKLS